MMSMRKILILLFLFSTAMGFLESAVVIYLRQLYYPDGFGFPLVVIPRDVAIVELLREAATLVMLLTVGILAGKTTAQRFCYFLYCFAVWDIFYYVFLKLFLGWPESLYTWDILFLLPVPWVGPVLAPCLSSLTMLLLMGMLFYFQSQQRTVRFNKTEWILLSAGALVIVGSFVQDYLTWITQRQPAEGSSTRDLLEDFKTYVPVSFNWWLFLAGETLSLLAIGSVWRRMRSEVAAQ